MTSAAIFSTDIISFWKLKQFQPSHKAIEFNNDTYRELSRELRSSGYMNTQWQEKMKE